MSAQTFFVGSALSLEPESPPTLLVKGKADDTVLRLVDAAGAKRIIIADEQKFSLSELQAQQQRITEALQQDRDTPFAVALDITSGRFDVSIAAEKTLTADAVVGLLPEELRNRVDIRLEETERFQPDTVFGGMEACTSSCFVCTTGFTVTDGFGQDAITTAGHCNNISQIFNPSTGTQAVVNGTQHIGTYGDVERHYEDDTIGQPDDFFSDSATIRDANEVETTAMLSVNERVCLYGRASNVRDCSTLVSSTSVTCTYSGLPTMSNLVRMNAHIGIPGDSGGPWSIAGRAYGLHSGQCGSGAIWSKAALLWQALGVSVKI